MPIRGIRFKNCSFTNSGFGVSLGLVGGIDFDDIEISSCTFDNNTRHLVAGAAHATTVNLNNIKITDCTFRENFNDCILLNLLTLSITATGSITNNNFDGYSGQIVTYPITARSPPYYNVLSTNPPAINFEGEVGPFRITGNRFMPFASGPFWAASAAISVQSGGHLIAENWFEENPNDLRPDGPNTEAYYKNRALLNADSPATLRSCTISNNIGDGLVVPGTGLYVILSVPATTVSVTGTSHAVTFDLPFPDADYQVRVTPQFDSGGCYVTGQTTTGFTINWPNSTAGATLTYSAGY